MSKLQKIVTLLLLITTQYSVCYVHPIEHVENDQLDTLPKSPIKIALEQQDKLYQQENLELPSEQDLDQSNQEYLSLSSEQDIDQSNQEYLSLSSEQDIDQSNEEYLSLSSEQDFDCSDSCHDKDFSDFILTREAPNHNYLTSFTHLINQHNDWFNDLEEQLTGEAQISKERDRNSFFINHKSIVEKFDDFKIFYLPMPLLHERTKDDFSDIVAMAASEPVAESAESSAASEPVAESTESNSSLPRQSDEEWPSIVSSACARDVLAIDEYIHKRSTKYNWHLKLMDSWGKGRDGMFIGNREGGFFQECLDVTAEGKYKAEALDFTGQYCIVRAIKIRNFTESRVPTSYGTCIPSSCSSEELQTSINFRIFPRGYWAYSIECQQRDVPLPSGTWVIIGCSVIGVMVLLVLIGTAAQLFLKDECPVVLKAFSATDNMSKILAVKMGDKGEILCMHGIRVMSMCWVILGHQYCFVMLFGSNILEIPKLMEPWAFQTVWGGYRAVDTFFTIGGLLLARGLLANDFCVKTKQQQTDDNQQQQKHSPGGYIDMQLIRSIQEQGANKTIINFVSTYFYFIFNRLVRILPAMLIVIMFCAGPAEWVVNGPSFPYYRDYVLANCRKHWWVDLTLFSNFISRFGGYGGCAPQSWYLGVDFQLYLVGPLFILPVKFFKHKLTYLSIMTFISCIIPGIIVMAKDLMPTIILTLNSEASGEYMDEIYIMPYARSSPYFVGAICALLMERVKNGDKENRWWKYISDKRVLLAGWVVCIGCCAVVVYSLAGYNYLRPEDEYPHFSSKFVEFLYASFMIALWSACVGWIVVVCAIGLGGPINTFLSHPMWQPLSRVTFSVFLIHLPMQQMINYSIHRPVYLTHLFMVLSWAGVVVFSYLAAFGISLVAEAPFINLLRIIKKK